MAKAKESMKDRDKKILQQISVFEKEQKKLSKLVGHKAGKDIESQQISLHAIRAGIAMLLSVVPKAEKIFLTYKNERAAYALTSLMNLLRELLRDLQALSTITKLGDRVIENAVDPAILNMAQTHISGLKDIRRIVYEKVDDLKLRKRILRRIDRTIDSETEHITEIRTQVTEQIEKIVQM